MLVLSYNQFNGSIPTSLSKLRNLRFLELEYNGLTGTIPTELGELSLLETLSLAYNSFDPGKLPTSFRNMTKLVRLWAGGCGLVGNFPSYVVIMKTELELLNLADNSLTGSLPPEVWSLNKLQFLIVATLPDT